MTLLTVRKEFLKRKEAFENKGLKVNHRKIRVTVSGWITKDGLFKSNVGSTAEE